MSNPLNAGQRQMPNISSLYQQFMQNPTQALLRSGFKIPDNIGNNPQQIAQYLLSSGQVSQSKLNATQQAVTRMGIKL
jgi:hypothetical protein